MSSDPHRPRPCRWWSRGVALPGLGLRGLLVLALGWIPLCNLLPVHGEPSPLARALVDPFRLPLPDAQLAAIVISRDLVVRSHQALLLPARLRDFDLAMTVVLTETEPLDLVLREWEPAGRPARWSALRLTPFLGGAPWFTSRERLPDPAEGGFRMGANAPTDVKITVRRGVARAVVGWQEVPGTGTLLDPQGQIGFVGSGEVKELRILPVREPQPALPLGLAALTLLVCLAVAIRTAAVCQGLRRIGEVGLGFAAAQGLFLWLAHRVDWLFFPDWLHLAASGGSALAALLLMAVAGPLRTRLLRASLPALLALLHAEAGLRGLPAADAWRSPAEELAALQYGEHEAGRSFGALARQFEDRHAVHRHDPASRTPKVVFLGGSQTFAEDLRPELAFPLLTAGTLRRSHSLEIEAVVAAARGASTIQQLQLFKEQLLFLEPRCVVLCASAHDAEPSGGADDGEALTRAMAAAQGPAVPPAWTHSSLLSLLLGPRPQRRSGPTRVAPATLRKALEDLGQLGRQLQFRVLLWPEPRPGEATLATLQSVAHEVTVAHAPEWAWIDTGDTIRPGANGLLDARAHTLLAAALAGPLQAALQVK